jgi:aminoglycoside phosphotransferase (APT) family kinase protein
MRNSLILAALAAAAVPGAGFRDVKELTNDLGGSINSALLTGADGKHFVVRQGATDAAALDLATEVAALRVIDALELPFKVSAVLGESRAPGQRPAVVFEYVYGKPVDLGRTRAGDALADSIGGAIAALHNLDAEPLREAGFPEYSPTETVNQRLNELDRLAGTGKIPKVLLDRWSEALENVSLFRFTPTVVNSNLSSTNVLELDGAVSGILGWNGLKIGDPAEDFSWLAGHADQELMDAVRFAYLGTRKIIDPNLSQRAHLYSEMHTARWMQHGLNIGDDGIVQEGVGMLNLLVEEVETGDVPALTAGTFAKPAGSFIEPVEEVEAAEPELEVVQDPHVVVFADDATREIELPEKTDDELF